MEHEYQIFIQHIEPHYPSVGSSHAKQATMLEYVPTTSSNIATIFYPSPYPSHILSSSSPMNISMTTVLDSPSSIFCHSHETPIHGTSTPHEDVGGGIVYIPSTCEVFSKEVHIQTSGTLSIELLMDINLVPLKLQKLPSNSYCMYFP